MFVNHSFLLSVHQAKSLHTVLYQLIATVTIAFSKTNCVATKRGWLLYVGVTIRGWLLNHCGEPKQHLCSIYVAKAT